MSVKTVKPVITINGETRTAEWNERTNSFEAPFTGKLVQVSPKPIGESKNGKPYHGATIEFTTKEGEIVRRRALMWAGNFAHGVSEGEEYLCKVGFSPERENPIVLVSHLQGNGIMPSADDFGWTYQDMQPDLVQTVTGSSEEVEELLENS